MVAFASLFLGLVLGVQTVELLVSDEVASVQIVLDGAHVTRLQEAPWSAEVDLGEELAPHELVAVALDARGQEVARASQWINLPRSAAEATLVVEAGPAGPSRTARLSWASLAGSATPRVRVVLDGKVLKVEDPSRFELPVGDSESVHLLRAELDFGEAASSSAEIVFGGRYGEQVSSELTAAPVVLTGRRKLPSVDRMDGWFEAGGRATRVVAVEKAVADIVVVRDQGAAPDLRRLVGLGPVSAGAVDLPRGNRSNFRSTWDQWRLQQLWPRARRAPGAARIYDLFPVSPFLDRRAGALPVAIALAQAPETAVAPQRLADAVVVAGLAGAGGKGRRAVILVLGGDPEDASRVQPGNARSFLERLHVPLYVWSTRFPVSGEVGSWAPRIDVSTPAKLQAAAFEVERALRSQRVLWLEGRHLPDRIALTERAVGIELAR